jgi:uncharacterized protein YqhQ
MVGDKDDTDIDVQEKIKKVSRERDRWYYVGVIFIFLFVLASIAIYVLATYINAVCDAISIIGKLPSVTGEPKDSNKSDLCPNLVGDWP